MQKNRRQQQKYYPCSQCGANLIYVPSQHFMLCEYCGFENPIADSTENIHEHDFAASLRQLHEYRKNEQQEVVTVTHCPSCAATFKWKAHEHAGHCPFCDTPVITDTQEISYFRPESILPFNITENQATTAFDQWMSSRWFAPSALSNKSKRDERLNGIYLPYWTYDSDTQTWYQGQRGTVYYERQYYTAIVNNRAVRRVRSVPRIRWTPVSGQVNKHFDDILVGATHTLPRKILDPLEPWDLRNLVPYSDAYISGFRSEVYQIELDQGFEQAKIIMDKHIHRLIRQDIGGDQQRITRKQTKNSETTFKHLLLPVWTAAFKYKGKTYRFVINGRNGKVEGERPYSIVKIALASLLGVGVIAGGLYFLEKQGMFDASQQEAFPHYYDPRYSY